GQAVFERLRSEGPDSRLVLLVRAKGGSSARARAEEVLTRPSFNATRDRFGRDGLKRLFDERVRVLEGDVTGALPTLPGDLDLVFHAAATVSFDPPIDEGFRTNLLGATRLYEAVHASGSTPRVVHVSTAYVAGSTKGIVPEAPLSHAVDWRTELEAALSSRRVVEESYRGREVVDRFMARARPTVARSG